MEWIPRSAISIGGVFSGFPERWILTNSESWAISVGKISMKLLGGNKWKKFLYI